ncbi:MAG: hypothetical protein KF855_04545 [Acidobacteria bacterium]|nr:hypothetical protein [Acidobacteriota bacterium]
MSSSILNRNSDGISVIEPRQYFEYHEVLYLENDPAIVPYARDHDEAVCIGRNSHSLSKLSSKDTPRLGDGQFKIEYRLSLKKFKNGEDVIDSIKKNLGAVGRLPLNSAGEIVYRTEDIILVQ